MAAYVRESYVVDRDAVKKAMQDWKGKESFRFLDSVRRLKRMVFS